jgi:predicted NBD/HSP70 family sugar kinase
MVSAKRLREMIRDAHAQGASSLPDDTPIDAICDRAARGDPFCTSLIDDVARWFIVGLGNVIMVNDPELIIIQGQYVKAGARFLEKLREGVRHIGLPDVEKQVRIEYSTLGEERGAVGGAAFVIADFFSRRLRFNLPSAGGLAMPSYNG